MSGRLRSRAAALWLAFGIALSVAAGPARAQEPSVQGPDTEGAPERPATGPVVTAIEVRSDAPLAGLPGPRGPDRDRGGQAARRGGRPPYPAQPPGERHGLRDRALHPRRSGGGGVVAVIVFRAVVQVAEVRVTGKLGLAGRSAAGVLPGGGRAPLRGAGGAGRLRHRGLYDSNGYFQGGPRRRADGRAGRRRAVVIYTVDSGPRATVSTIAFSARRPLPARRALVQQLRIKPGDPTAGGMAREDAERLQDWLIRQQYGAARVDPPVEEREPESNTVKLTYPIEIGPKISLVVDGRRREEAAPQGAPPLPRRVRLSTRPWCSRRSAGSRATTSSRGITTSGSTPTRSGPNGELVLTFPSSPARCTPSGRSSSRATRRSRAPTLRQVVGHRPSAASCAGGSGRLVQVELDEDLENLRRYYALRATRRPRPGRPRSRARARTSGWSSRSGRVRASAWSTSSSRGSTSLDADALRSNLPLRAGGGSTPSSSTAPWTTSAPVRRQGVYPGPGLRPAGLEPGPHAGGLTIEALEGPQQVANRILVRGNQRTEGDVIRGPSTSTAASRSARPSCSRPSAASISSASSPASTWSSSPPGSKDRARRADPGRGGEAAQRPLRHRLGLRGRRPRLVGFTDNNVWGKAYSLRTDLRWSQRDKRFHVLFNQPYLGERPVSLTSTVFYEEEAPRDRPFRR